MDINKSRMHEITEMMMSSVRKDEVPWEKVWVDKEGKFEGFKNAKTGKTYGVKETLNLLGQGCKDEYVATGEEWADLGYRTNATTVYKMLDGTLLAGSSDTLDENGEPYKAPEVTYPGEDFARNRLDEVLDAYFTAEGIAFVETEGSKSYYSPSEDKVVLPLRKQFTSAAGYYATKAHEAIHSTGAYIRCDREGFDDRRYTEFGSMKYSREELVAEMGACFLLVAFGIDTKQTERNTLAYCQSWLKELQGNPKWIRKASELALEAVEYILEYADED